VFDSTSSIHREPVHTKHFLSPSTKPALIKYSRSDSNPGLSTSSPYRNNNITTNSNYFKAGAGLPISNNGTSVNSGRSVTSKAPSLARKQEVPARKAAVPVQAHRVGRADVTRSDRANSFASTIGTTMSMSGMSSLGGGGDIPDRSTLHRGASFSSELRRSQDSDRVFIDGRAQVREPPRTTANDSQSGRQTWASHPNEPLRGRSYSGGGASSVHSGSPRSRAPSHSRSPDRSRSRSRSPPKEIQSKYRNVTAHYFPIEGSPRQVF
jgi:hypothetical protein